MDPQVLAAQQYLNATYAGVAGWAPLTEDGWTGWSTVYGLRRALQSELGISPTSSGFGAATTAAYAQRIRRLDGSTTSARLLRLLSATLWCKGYAGIYPGDPVSWASLSGTVKTVRDDLGLGTSDPYVDVKLMTTLMSMDAYIRLGDGSDSVRAVQRWLNGTYVARRDFALGPCDGVFSRAVQTALLFALQYEIGLADGVANGTFGPATRDGIRAKALVRSGSKDGATRFVRLYQGALRFNGYEAPFTGTFDTSTVSRTKELQTFLELPVSGEGTYSTWCALLVSSGDTSLSTLGFDTNQQLTAAEAKGAVALGYQVAGRYVVGAGKFITSAELGYLKAAGLKLLPIHQRLNNTPSVMTEANGRLHGREAVERCRVLGLPKGTGIVFAVDFDATAEVVAGPVCDYFRGVKEAVEAVASEPFTILVYGTRNVCSEVIEQGLAKGAFVAGMSTGWSGNMGFRMPAAWQYNQVVETSVQFPGSTRTIAIDKVVVSRARSAPASLASVEPPPVERDGSTTATGFDAFFEWYVRAEVACERVLTSIWAPHVHVFVLFYLQKPKYWPPEHEWWPVYTPSPYTDASMLDLQAAVESEMAALDPPKPATTRDAAHFAVTLRGYLIYGLPTTTSSYGAGDLGGWALDLLQVWGKWERTINATPGLDLRTWLTGEIGKRGVSRGFAYEDAVADADAFLVRRSMKVNGWSLGRALRRVFQQPTATRLRAFYAQRFDSSAATLDAAFASLTDGLDAGPVNVPLTKFAVLQMAGASAMPTAAQRQICTSVLARFLASA